MNMKIKELQKIYPYIKQTRKNVHWRRLHETEIQNDDKRQEAYIDELVTESYVEFFFTFNNEQINTLKDALLSKTLLTGDNPEILIHEDKVLKYIIYRKNNFLETG